jgi:hypothetical protein
MIEYNDLYLLDDLANCYGMNEHAETAPILQPRSLKGGKDDAASSVYISYLMRGTQSVPTK